MKLHACTATGYELVRVISQVYYANVLQKPQLRPEIEKARQRTHFLRLSSQLSNINIDFESEEIVNHDWI